MKAYDTSPYFYMDINCLQEAISAGIIDESYVQNLIAMKRRKDLLEKHPWAIYENKGNWYTYLPNEEKGRILKKRKSREAIEDLIIEYYEQEENKRYFRDVFKEWMESKLEYGEIKKQSYDRYYTDFDRFFPEDSQICKIEFGNITEADLTDFIKTTIKEKNLSQKSYAGLRTIIRGVFNYGKMKKYTNLSMTNFFGDLVLSQTQFKKVAKKTEEQVFMEDEVPQIASYLRNHPTIWNLGLLLQFETGIRIGELSALKKEDIDGNVLYIRRTEVKRKDEEGKWKVYVQEQPKTIAGDRSIILSDMALCTLAQIFRINPNGEYIFQNDKGVRIRENTFNKRLTDVCRDLKIPQRSTHKIRRTNATTLFNSNLPEAFVASQIGHKEIATTKKYYYFDNKKGNNKKEMINNAITF